MSIAISGIGLATAQGNSSAIVEGKTLHSASELPWTPNNWNVSRIGYPAQGIDSSRSGLSRWQALVKNAFADLGGSDNVPLLVASCNASAAESWEDAFDTSSLLEGTPWANEHLPVFSSSCASGVHALYAARQLLTAGAVDEVLVLAADILAQSNHENFESLRVLAEKPEPPWQLTSSGFLLGEAAVVVRLVRATNESPLPILNGPELRSDLIEYDGLSNVIEGLSPQNPALILGQGTGPYTNDTAELAAFSAFVNKEIPLATPLPNFGHTLGASGLLATALGALAHQTTSPIAALANPAVAASDGRPLCRGGTPWPPLREILATCRALNGACAASSLARAFDAKPQRRKGEWRRIMTPGPLMNSTLKRLASEAMEHRPMNPPDVLIVRLEKPLSPQASAIIGGRLLPSAVLEITPGFASQLIARCWGFSGPALCLVGDVDHHQYGLVNAFSESGLKIFQVNLRGTGENRAIEWNV